MEGKGPMSLGIQIDVLGLECNTDVADTDGVIWECEPVDGWSSATLRRGALDPTGRHGVSPLVQFRGGRPLAIKGAASGPHGDPTQAAAWAAYNRLASILDTNESGDVIVYEPTPKLVTATLDGESFISDPVNNQIQWDLKLVASFPYKTALTPTVTSLAASASTTLTNNGTAAAYPVVTATSSGTVDLVIGGRHFTTASVASGVVIDMWARTLVDGSGDPVYAAKTPESEWLSLPRGGTSVSNAGTAALSIAHYHTYN